MDQEMTGLLLIFVPIVAVGAIVSMMGHAKNIEDREKGVEASKKTKVLEMEIMDLRKEIEMIKNK